MPCFLRVYCLLLVLPALLASPVRAQEVLTLIIPESQGFADRTTWSIKQMHFTFQDGVLNDYNEIEVILIDNTNGRIRCSYSGDNSSNAHDDQVVLNTANLTSSSLKKRTLDRLTMFGGQVDSNGNDTPCLAEGTVTGTPES